MKNNILIILSTILLSLPAAADMDILVLGSSKTYSKNSQPGGMKEEKAFNPKLVATQLEKILAKSIAVKEKVNVVYQDVYTEKIVHTDVAGWKKPSFRCAKTQYKCYSLAQFFFWPDGKKERLQNLRGEGATKWDYVIITGDPYIMANFPGLYAIGAGLVADEIAKGSAKPVLMAQWPASGSTVTADDLNELVYRVGNSGGYTVVPAGKAWKTLRSKDPTSAHPTPHGSYLAAACVYTELFRKRPSNSRYRYNTTIANHAASTIKKNMNALQYEGLYTKPNAFQMKHDCSRHVDLNHTGTSTENGFLGEILSAMKRCKVTSKRYEHPSKWPDGLKPINFNYGRANAMFEPKKRYDPANCNQGKKYYNRTYGFPMQDHGWSAKKSMEYGIDWRKLISDKLNQYDDGTDLGIATKIVKEDNVKNDARAIPVRLLVARCRHIKPDLPIQHDSWHFSAWADEAVGTFIYTLQSGRCPMTDEPADKNTDDWNKWLGRKVGYETAWQIARLTNRAPGLQIRPSSNNPSIDSGGNDKISIRFMLPPKKDVTVGVFIDASGCVDVSPRKLTFTPENYNKIQTVTATGTAGKPTSVRFETRSDDPVYDRLQDSWAYKLK